MGFNALKYVEDLRTAGVPDQQAEAQIRILHEIIEADLSTKRDTLEITNHIKLLENSNQEIKREIKVLEKEIIKIKESVFKLEQGFQGLRQDFKGLEQKSEKLEQGFQGLKQDFKELELRMTIKLGSLLIIALSALVALSKLNLI